MEKPVRVPEQANPSEKLVLREYSKSEMADEREQLAVELSQERKIWRATIENLRKDIENAKRAIKPTTQSIEAAEATLEAFLAQRDERANSLAGRIKNFVGFETRSDLALEVSITDQQTRLNELREDHARLAQEYTVAITALVDTDEALKQLKEKVIAHYGEAHMQISQQRVGQVTERTGALFVHMMTSRGRDWRKQQWDINNKVIGGTSFEDELDIVLSLEPSIAASSVLPGTDEDGRVSRVWPGDYGLLIADGRISAASNSDIASVATRIKERTPNPRRFDSHLQTAEEVDTIATNRADTHTDYIVNNPKIAGCFTQVTQDEEGLLWIQNGGNTAKNVQLTIEQYDLQNDPLALQKTIDSMEQKLIAPFRLQMALASKRGLPFYVMAPDRQFYEVQAIRPNGSLEVGPSLTAEQIRTGIAGLPPERRKEIGAQLLEKNIFTDMEKQTEAQRIIARLNT